VTIRRILSIRYNVEWLHLYNLEFVVFLVLCNATLMMFVKAIETYW